MLKIITAPNPILTQPSKVVQKIDKKILNLVKEMIETLASQKDPEGVGLAAPQVGFDLRIFIIKPSKKYNVETFINPKLISKTPLSQRKKEENNKIRLEGCLSIPKVWGNVKRSPKILLEYQTLEGKTKRKWFSGFKAIIIQHELDHLDGILFTQRIIEQKGRLYKENENKLLPLDF